MSPRSERLEKELGGRYRLARILGRGGMGEVWAAHDPALERAVAIKIMGAELSEDAEFVGRFRRETRTLAKFQHPRIVRVIEVGTIRSDGRLYMVMERVPGRSLSCILDDGAVLDHVIAALYTVQMADALRAAHAMGIIHRDVKPENVMVSHQGHVTLLDFGLAKVAEATGRHDGGKRWAATVTAKDGSKRSTLLGTARYMAPELIVHGRSDRRSDLYSLGIVLVRMLTRKDPYVFEAGDERAMLLAHVEQAPMLAKEENRECPEALWAIALKLLEKNPDDRFQSAAEVDDALSAFVRVSAVPGHELAGTIEAERKERRQREVFEAHSAASVSRGGRGREAEEVREAPAAKVPEAKAPLAKVPDQTAPLAVGFVPVSPCADVTRPMSAKAAPAMVEPHPLARPRREGVVDVGALRPRSVEAVESPVSLADRAGVGSVRAAEAAEKSAPPRPRGGRALKLAGIALGTMGAWALVVSGMMAWKMLEQAPGTAATAPASAAPTVMATASATSAPAATGVATATATVVPTAMASTKGTATPPASARGTGSARSPAQAKKQVSPPALRPLIF